MTGIEADSPYGKEFKRFTKKLRERILALRRECGLTQEDMQGYGLSLRQYQRIESGETSNVTLGNLYKIAKAFGMSVSELLDL